MHTECDRADGRSWERQLRALGLSSLERRRLRSSLRRECAKRGSELFSLGSRNKMGGNGSKLCQGHFRLDIRKHFCTEQVVRHWNRLPKKLVDTPGLSVFETFG